MVSRYINFQVKKINLQVWGVATAWRHRGDVLESDGHESIGHGSAREYKFLKDASDKEEELCPNDLQSI